MKAQRWSAHGKWILVGEHSVLRGCPALVFPVWGRCLNSQYQYSDEPLKVEISGREGEPLRLLFWGVIESALQRTGRSRNDLKGHLRVENEIPLGTGLGASAAICVAVGRWWQSMGWIKKSELYEFSRSLEDMFHGESSGVDIAASMSECGIRFLRGGERTPIAMNWQPHWFLSYSGQRGVTAECVRKVKGLKDRNPDLLARLDEQMRNAVGKAESALQARSQEEGLPGLVESIQLANSCFEQWGLIDGDLAEHIKTLKRLGAIAVKPTGSGGGGYVLSLWAKPPVLNQLDFELMPLNGFSGNK